MSTHVAGFQRSVAVIIGIDQYSNGIPPLATPVDDARQLAQRLKDDHGYEIHLLVEEVNRQALALFFTHTLAQEISRQDRLLVYFAGHGIALDGDDGPQGFLIPQDAHSGESSTFLPMTELHGWLDALPCRHLLVVLDCCFAGAFRWAGTRDLRPLPERIYKERYDRFIQDPAWQVITSAAYDQKALDVLAGNFVGKRDSMGTDGQRHSPFALALFDALAGAGDIVPKGQGDGVITASELALALRDFVELRTHRQTPGLWPLKKHDKGEYIFLVPGHELNLPPAPPLTDKNNPYRGLKAYEEEDAELFFGRRALVEKLATLVAEQPLTVVLGASGTGKSSVVKAGLLPYLRTKLDDTEHPVVGPATHAAGCCWLILPPVRPGDAPLDALAQAVATLKPGAGEGRSVLDSDVPVHATLQTGIEEWLAAHPEHFLLLVIDQFEELVTLCRDEHHRLQFQRVLADLIDCHGDCLRLVLTLRTDFEPQFANSPLFTRRKATPVNRFIVPPMSQAELRTVIEGPAAVRVLFFDPSALVDALIDEVIQTPGALPLLSFTLEQLYLKYLQRQELAQNRGETLERSLIWADYEELGGVIGSLRTRADQEYDRLPDDAHRATMQGVMMRMVAVEGGELARRRVALEELRYPGAEENERVQTVLDALVTARLVVRGQDDSDGDGTADTYVEPAHDALVRAWGKLLVWKRAADEYLPLQRRLTQAANEWKRTEGSAKTGLLWNNNPRLGQLQHVLVGETIKGETNGWIANVQQMLWPKTAATNQPTWLNQLETEFVQTSVNRRASILRRIVGITVTIVLALTAIATFAEIQRREANSQRSEANIQRDNAVRAQGTAIAEADARETEVVMRATAQAVALTREADAVIAEATAVAERDEAQRQARNSRSNQLAIQAQSALDNDEDRSGSLALLLARAALQTNLNAGDTPTSQAIETLRLVYDRLPPFVISFPVGNKSLTQSTPTWSVYNHEGTRLAISKELSVDLIDPHTGEKLATLDGHTSNVYIGRLSPTADLLATSSGRAEAKTPDYTVRLWDLTNGKEKFTLRGHTDYVQMITFSNSGHTLVTASKDKTLRFWDVATGQQVAVMDGFEQPVQYIEFSSDGKVMMTTDEANSVTAWEAETHDELQHFANARLAAANPVSPSFALALVDQTICLWRPTNPKDKCYASKDAGEIISLAISPKGNFLAYTTTDNRTHVLNIQTDEYLYTIENAQKPQFSPDNTLLTTIADAEYSDNYVEVWDLSSGKRVERLAGHTYLIDSVTFSPDSQTIVTTAGHGQACHSCASDNTLRIWDLRRARQKVRARNWEALTASNVSHAGDLAVIQVQSASTDTLDLWRIDTLEPVRELHDSGLLDSATSYYDLLQKVRTFSPDDQLVAANDGKMVIVWRVSSGVPLYRFDHYSSTVTTLAFHPTRSLLLVGTEDGTSHLYNLNNGKPLSTSIGLNESLHQIRFSADGRYLATCGNRLQLWKIDNQQAENLAASPLHLQTENVAVESTTCDFIQFSPDSKLLMATFGTTVPVWDLQNGQQISTLTTSSYGGQALFSPNSELVATITTDYPGIVTIWDVKSGQAKHILRGHVGQILALAFSPDSRKLVSAGGQVNTYALEDNFRLDWAARLWDVETGRLIEVLERFREHRALTDAVFSMDGTTIYTASDGSGVIVWPLWEELYQQSKSLLQRNPPYLTEDELLEFDVIDAESISAAQDLIAQAMEMARANHLAQAHELVDAALKLNPYLNLEAINEEITRIVGENP